MRVHAVLTAGCLSVALLATALPAQAGSGESTQVAISKADAQTLAKAGILKKSDLRGFEVERYKAEPEDAADEKSVYTCLGAPKPKLAARNRGFGYSLGNLTVDSSADVLASVAKAKADLKAYKSSKAPSCFEDLFTTILERQGAEVTSVTVKRIKVKGIGGDGVSAMRLIAEFTSEGNAIRLDSHLLMILVGQTEIFLSPTAFNGPVPSLKQTVKLAKTLVERVRAV